jgi:hypothetical protein
MIARYFDPASEQAVAVTVARSAWRFSPEHETTPTFTTFAASLPERCCC